MFFTLTCQAIAILASATAAGILTDLKCGVSEVERCLRDIVFFTMTGQACHTDQIYNFLLLAMIMHLRRSILLWQKVFLFLFLTVLRRWLKQEMEGVLFFFKELRLPAFLLRQWTRKYRILYNHNFFRIRLIFDNHIFFWYVHTNFRKFWLAIDQNMYEKP